jgi:tRNA A37 threonylcarbamoyladenosine modification protein TsaB
VIQPLSYSLGIPFLSLSSLEVLAFSALQSRPSSGNTPIPIAVAMDARMNGVYWASFIGKGGVLTRVDEDCLISQDKFLARSHALHEDGLVVGDAWAPEMMGQCGVDCIAERTASSVIELASNKPDTDWNHNATECLPYYVQSSVTWQKRARFLSVERDNSST